MASTELLSPLAGSFLSSSKVGGSAARVITAIADGRHLDRLQYDSLVGDPSPGTDATLCDFLLHCVRAFLGDHALTLEEKAAIRYLWRLFRIPENDLVRLRPSEVGAMMANELGRLLEDRAIDAKEALHQVDLQEALGLGYDQYLELTKPYVHKVLLHLVGQIDADQDRVVSEEELAWYFRQVAALDTVFNLNPQTEAQGTEPGYLYVLVNPSMPGIVKIGKTTRSPVLRAREIGATTGVPTPFLLVFDIAVPDCSKAERYVHERLESSGQRVATNREFFRVAPPEALALLQDAKVATAAA